MAFVYRAERDMKYDSTEVNDTAPGSYDLGSSFRSQEKNAAPFNSLVRRNKNSFIPINETPGPGTYEREYQNVLEHKKTKPKEINIYQAVESNILPQQLIDLYKKRERVAFNTKGERFKYNSDKKNIDLIPGPGSYDISTSFSSINNSDIKKKQNKLKFGEVLTTGSIYRKTTIPSWENFGYEDTKEGLEKMIEDPEKDIKFTGEKNDTIGPGHYNINSTWNANVIKWRNPDKLKYKSRTLSRENNNKNSFETNIKKDYKKNNDKSVLLKYYLNKRYNTVRALKEKKDNSPTDFIFDATPGPGYYTQEFEGWKTKTNSKGSLQSFDTTAPRFQESKITKNDLGPGFYYNFSHPKEKIFPQYKVGKLLNNSDKDAIKKSAFNLSNTKHDTTNKIGPGSYDVSGNLMKKKISNVDSFGIKEKRFKYKIDNENPGPGYYLGTNDLNDNKNENDDKNSPHLINKSLADNDEKKFVVEHYEPPPIGSYNPGLVLSMNYKVQSNVNAFQDNKKVGFGVQDKRFNYNNKSDFLGPGLYYKNLPKDVKQNAAPFNENNKRFNYKKDKMPIPGPGSYELSNFNEWDKKSFNILFV